MALEKGLLFLLRILMPSENVHHAPRMVRSSTKQEGTGVRVSPGDAGEAALLVHLAEPLETVV